MTGLKAGDKAPDFTLPTDSNSEITLSALKGKKVVVYFYPKDDTPGCTKEACGFRDAMADLKKLGAEVIGISKDSPAKHDKFKAKYELNFPLAADEDGSVCESYGVWGVKMLYGRKYMGIERATFLIGEDGKILNVWRNVKVGGHVEKVTQAIRDAGKKAA